MSYLLFYLYSVVSPLLFQKINVQSFSDTCETLFSLTLHSYSIANIHKILCNMVPNRPEDPYFRIETVFPTLY